MIEKIIKFLQQFVKQIEVPELLPIGAKRIKYASLMGLLKERCPNAQIFLSDKDYLLCNKEDIVSFLIRDKTNKTEFVPNEYDCDDFSYRLMGQMSIPKWSDLAFGIVWTDKHALNCYIGEDKVFKFIEPQTDTIQSGLQEWQGSEIRLIII